MEQDKQQLPANDMLHAVSSFPALFWSHYNTGVFAMQGACYGCFAPFRKKQTDGLSGYTNEDDITPKWEHVKTTENSEYTAKNNAE